MSQTTYTSVFTTPTATLKNQYLEVGKYVKIQINITGNGNQSPQVTYKARTSTVAP